MFRRCWTLFVDTYAERQAKFATLLMTQHKATDLSASLSQELLSMQTRRMQTSHVEELVEVCRKQGLWMQCTVVLTTAARVKLELRQRWIATTMALVRANGTAADVAMVKQTLAPLLNAGGYVEGKRRSEGEALSTAVVRDNAVVPNDNNESAIITGTPKGAGLAVLHMASTPTDPATIVHSTPEMDECFKRLPCIRTDPDKLVALTKALHRAPPRLVRLNSGNAVSALVQYEAQSVKGMRPVPWYPGRWAWQIDSSASAEDRAKANTWMKAVVDAGHGHYQSPGSLLPVLALAPHASWRVLDMCAAPGSKTRQLCDVMNPSQSVWPQGTIVANERSVRRFRSLADNMAAYPNVVLCNTDASRLRHTLQPDAADDSLFDGVLLDAPCSGEGTFYKDPQSAARWSMDVVMRHHAVQLRLLQQAIDAAKPGAPIVYSTCTVNPFENEAVVARILEANRDTVRLDEVPVPEELRSILSPGFPKWWTPRELTQSTAACRGYWDDLKLCRRVLPHLPGASASMDAFFFARFVKRGGDERRIGRLISVSSPVPKSSSDDHALAGCKSGPALLDPASDLVLKDIFDTFGMSAASMPADLVFARRRSSAPGALVSEYDVVAMSKRAVDYAGDRWEAGALVVAQGRADEDHKTKAVTTHWLLSHEGARLFANLCTQRVVELPLRMITKVLAADGMDVAKDSRDQLEVVKNNKAIVVDRQHQAWSSAIRELSDGPIVLTATLEGRVVVALSGFVVRAESMLRCDLVPVSAATKGGLVRCVGALVAASGQSEPLPREVTPSRHSEAPRTSDSAEGQTAFTEAVSRRTVLASRLFGTAGSNPITSQPTRGRSLRRPNGTTINL